MQMKKEIIAFSILITLCAILMFTASFSMNSTATCGETKQQEKTTCQQLPNSKNLPWNFFTHSLLHFSS